ncbi:MAG: Zinc finger protein dzip1 [Paramarteilia canceri]
MKRLSDYTKICKLPELVQGFDEIRDITDLDTRIKHFKFKKRKMPFNLEKMKSALKRNIQGYDDVYLLQDIVQDLTYSDIESEVYEGRINEPLLLSLTKLAQFSIEYLLFTQEYLVELVGKLGEHLEKNLIYNKRMSQDRTISSGQSGTSGSIQCSFCPKNFITQTYLQNHIERRHSEEKSSISTNNQNYSGIGSHTSKFSHSSKPVANLRGKNKNEDIEWSNSAIKSELIKIKELIKKSIPIGEHKEKFDAGSTDKTRCAKLAKDKCENTDESKTEIENSERKIENDLENISKKITESHQKILNKVESISSKKEYPRESPELLEKTTSKLVQENMNKIESIIKNEIVEKISKSIDRSRSSDKQKIETIEKKIEKNIETMENNLEKNNETRQQIENSTHSQEKHIKVIDKKVQNTLDTVCQQGKDIEKIKNCLKSFKTNCTHSNCKAHSNSKSNSKNKRNQYDPSDFDASKFADAEQNDKENLQNSTFSLNNKISKEKRLKIMCRRIKRNENRRSACKELDIIQTINSRLRELGIPSDVNGISDKAHEAALLKLRQKYPLNEKQLNFRKYCEKKVSKVSMSLRKNYCIIKGEKLTNKSEKNTSKILEKNELDTVPSFDFAHSRSIRSSSPLKTKENTYNYLQESNENKVLKNEGKNVSFSEEVQGLRFASDISNSEEDLSKSHSEDSPSSFEY